MKEADYIFKILIVGSSATGKSNLLLRFADNVFHTTLLPTIGVDFKIKTIALKGEQPSKVAKLNIWDTAGQERFRNINSTYYKGSHGVMIVYDITDRESFNSVPMWLSEVEAHAGPGVVRLLIGNKSDLEEQRKVPAKEGQALAERYGMKFVETSAKSGARVEEAFQLLAEEIHRQWPETEETPGRALRIKRAEKSGGCCS